MPYTNRIRMPIIFGKPQFPVERNIFRKADGTSKVLSMIIRNTFEGKTDQLPEAWHKKLVIALSHDTVTIENERLMSNVVLDGDYGIDWEDFLNKPIAPAQFNIQVTPFSATNDNCGTCDELTQVVCNDDSTTEVWDEGTTHDFPDVLTDNDEICCLPFEITLVSFNPVYFSSASISAAGILTATVIDPAPIADDVWIATYQVTCPDGSYDRAQVYGNITGTDSSFCLPALAPEYIATGSTTATISWGVPVPVPSGDWIWNLYLTSDLATAIQSGTVAPAAGTVNLTGLTPGISYTFVVIADCGSGNYSLPTSLEFTITAFVADTCALFNVVYLPSASDPPQSISYMDCAGTITNRTMAVAETFQECMMILIGETTPLYFVASSEDISITYDSPCP